MCILETPEAEQLMGEPERARSQTPTSGSVEGSGPGGVETFWRERALELAGRLRRGLAVFGFVPGGGKGRGLGDLAEEDDDTVRRHAAWAVAGGCSGNAAKGVTAVAAALSGLGRSLQGLHRRFERLSEDLLSLDDGDAEALFSGQGPLSGAVAHAQTAAQACGAAAAGALEGRTMFGCVSSTWVQLPDPELAVECLEAGAGAIGDSLAKLEQLEARRRASIARARAAIEFRAAPEASGIEVCQRAELDEEGAPAPADAPPPEPQKGPRSPLEFDEEGTPAPADALLPELRKGPRPDAELCAPLVGCGLLGLLTRLAPPRASAPWAASAPCSTGAAPSGTRAAGMRLSAAWKSAGMAAEDLACQLRWHRRVPSKYDVPVVLDGMFHVFDQLASGLARLHEELACLDGESAVEPSKMDQQGGEGIPALVLAASHVQKRTLRWKCRLIDAPEACSRGRPSAQELSRFLQEAVAVGNGLEESHSRLALRRDEAVEMLKASIEVVGCAAETASVGRAMEAR
mmetsp:Transcript_77445/g.239054  ORF Transcript_77445/g.239054 Transcript_77445/m.239054 type:complete len:517 (-) Transcript_77445:206-1756(-)